MKVFFGLMSGVCFLNWRFKIKPFVNALHPITSKSVGKVLGNDDIARQSHLGCDVYIPGFHLCEFISAFFLLGFNCG